MEYKDLLVEAKKRYDLGMFKVEVPGLFQEKFFGLPHICAYCKKPVRGNVIIIDVKFFEVGFDKTCLDIMVL